MRPFELEGQPSNDLAREVVGGLPLIEQQAVQTSTQSFPTTSIIQEGYAVDLGINGPLPVEQFRQAARSWADQVPPPLVYEVWTQLGGKIRFRCKGRLVTGPPGVDLKFNVFAWFMVIMPTAAYLILCAQRMWQRDPPQLMCTIALWAGTVILLLLTSFTDPGIIPRPAQQLLTESLEDDVAHAVGAVGLRPGAERLPTQGEFDLMMDNLGDRGYTWCRFCQMLQPPRAKHCRDCDVCTLRIDHHCPFVNNCIGQRNYAYFCGFLLSAACLGISVFGGVFHWSQLSEDSLDDRGSISSVVAFLLLGVTTALIVSGIAGLGLFHLALILTGRTTREVLRPRRIPVHGATLCGFRGPSLIPARQRVRPHSGGPASRGDGPAVPGANASGGAAGVQER